jgi:hypothetical protein
MDLVRRVDEAIQARFASVTQEDMKGLVFGITRVAPKKRAHGWVFEPRVDSERELLAALGDKGWRGEIYVASPGVMGTRGPVLLGDQAIEKSHRSAAHRLGTRCYQEGAPLQDQDDDAQLEARPVLASKPLCLKCHEERKLGKPIAAVVYVFTREKTWVPTSGE